RPQRIDPGSWRLQVSGQVQQPMELPYDELDGNAETVTATLECTGGWYTTQRWTGVTVGRILERARLKPDAASVTIRSVTGYHRRFSLAEASRLVLATRVGSERLSHRHGSPLRLVAPGKRGYDWVKWVTAIEVNDTSKWLQPPLPLE
ncbi:MAG: molybdopterin-dependent oxidoreductase, partial [Dehalococcoidia bacterium]